MSVDTNRVTHSLSSIPVLISPVHISERGKGSSMSSLRSNNSTHSAASSGGYDYRSEDADADERELLQPSPSPMPAIDVRRRQGRFSICVPQGTPDVTLRSLENHSNSSADEDSGRGSRTPPNSLRGGEDGPSPFESGGEVSPATAPHSNLTVNTQHNEHKRVNMVKHASPLQFSPSKEQHNDIVVGGSDVEEGNDDDDDGDRDGGGDSTPHNMSIDMRYDSGGSNLASPMSPALKMKKGSSRFVIPTPGPGHTHTEEDNNSVSSPISTGRSNRSILSSTNNSNNVDDRRRTMSSNNGDIYNTTNAMRETKSSLSSLTVSSTEGTPRPSSLANSDNNNDHQSDDEKRSRSRSRFQSTRASDMQIQNNDDSERIVSTSGDGDAREVTDRRVSRTENDGGRSGSTEDAEDVEYVVDDEDDDEEEEYVDYSDDSESDRGGSDLDEMADFNHRESSAFSTVSTSFADDGNGEQRQRGHSDSIIQEENHHGVDEDEREEANRNRLSSLDHHDAINENTTEQEGNDSSATSDGGVEDEDDPFEDEHEVTVDHEDDDDEEEDDIQSAQEMEDDEENEELEQRHRASSIMSSSSSMEPDSVPSSSNGTGGGGGAAGDGGGDGEGEGISGGNGGTVVSGCGGGKPTRFAVVREPSYHEIDPNEDKDNYDDEMDDRRDYGVSSPNMRPGSPATPNHLSHSRQFSQGNDVFELGGRSPERTVTHRMPLHQLREMHSTYSDSVGQLLQDYEDLNERHRVTLNDLSEARREITELKHKLAAAEGRR